MKKQIRFILTMIAIGITITSCENAVDYNQDSITQEKTTQTPPVDFEGNPEILLSTSQINNSIVGSGGGIISDPNLLHIQGNLKGQLPEIFPDPSHVFPIRHCLGKLWIFDTNSNWHLITNFETGNNGQIDITLNTKYMFLSYSPKEWYLDFYSQNAYAQVFDGNKTVYRYTCGWTNAGFNGGNVGDKIMYDYDWDHRSRAFYLLDRSFSAHEFITSHYQDPLFLLKIRWDNSDDGLDKDVTQFDPNTQIIKIGKFVIITEPYTILHEIGHAYQFRFWNWWLPPGSGGIHWDIDKHSNVGFALSEGWATFFRKAVVTENKWNDDKGTKWIGGTDLVLDPTQYDVENYVQSVLWDLVDDPDEKENYTFPIEWILKATFKTKTASIADFVTNWSDLGYPAF